MITAPGGAYLPPKAPNLQEGRSPPLPGAGRLLYLDRSDPVARLPIPLRVALADGVYDVHPPDDSSEDGVASVQPRRRHAGDEELRTARARPRVRHREDARLVVLEVRVELVPDAVAGPAR